MDGGEFVKMSKLKIYFCPRSKSAKVQRIFEMGNIFGLMPTWRCQKCQFQSAIFPMAVGDSETVKKLNRNKNKKTIRKTKTTKRKK